MKTGMLDVTHVAGVARLLSSPTRLRIIGRLLAGECSASDLSAQLSLSLPMVSRHLGILRRHALVTVHRWRRLSLYSLTGAPARAALTFLQRFPRRGPHRIGVPARLRRQSSDLRHVRTCYDHLAGGAGVYLLSELLRRRWIVVRENGARPTYALTTRGAQGLVRRRVNVLRAGRAKRMFAIACGDWSRDRTHLGGALGAAILSALLNSGIAHPAKGARRLVLQSSLGQWLGPAPRRRTPRRGGRPE